MSQVRGKGGSREALKGLPDRTLYDALKVNGHGELAKELNPITARSRKDDLGAIVLRAHSGVDNTSAARVAKEFEDRAGGVMGVAEKLAAVEEHLPGGLKGLAAKLSDPANAGKRLYRILAEEKVSLLGVMKGYVKGCVELAQIEAAVEAHRGMPAIVKDLVRHAIDGDPRVCGTCMGTGSVRAKSSDNKEKVMCPSCEGEGALVKISPHKEFAAKTILEITKQLETGKGGVNVAVGINLAAGGKSYAERMIDAADKVLYGKKEDVIDVEGRAL